MESAYNTRRHTNMNRYYVFDTTVNPVKYVTFDTVPQVVKYLEEYIQRALKQTRPQFMYELAELGHGEDDPRGVNFTRQLSEYVNIGKIQNGKPVKCDIHVAERFSSPEYGQ